MGIFYNPPQPPTSSGSGTTPEPHAPIGAQGDAPPRYTTALMVVAVLASWPADLEPRIGPPNNAQRHIAPLTLQYGAPPVPQSPLSVSELAQIVGAWTLDVPVVQTTRSIASLLVTTPQLPQPPLSATELSQIVTSWTPDLSVVRRPIPIAPLTLVYGAQPTPTPALNPAEWQSIAAWPSPAWPSQSAPASLAWVTPPATFPSARFPYGLILARWPADLEPRLGRPNDQPQKIAPLTLAYGAPPASRPALSVSMLSSTVAAWIQTWGAQAAPKNASWNVPPIVTIVPYTPPPYLVLLAAHQAPFIRPQARVAIAPLTLPYGQQAPLVGTTRQTATIIASWLRDLEPRLDLPNWLQQKIAPLALVYGAPLPPQPALSVRALALVLSAWVPPWVQPEPPATLTLPLSDVGRLPDDEYLATLIVLSPRRTVASLDDDRDLEALITQTLRLL